MISYRKKSFAPMQILLSIIFFLLVFFFVWFGLTFMGEKSSNSQLTMMETSILRNAVQCYAIEGRYPSDLTYLEKNYNVALNKNRYVYHYVYLGENMMPQVFLF